MTPEQPGDRGAGHPKKRSDRASLQRPSAGETAEERKAMRRAEKRARREEAQHKALPLHKKVLRFLKTRFRTLTSRQK
jgi:hypothetical protein